MPTGFVLLLLFAAIAPIVAQFAGSGFMKVTVGGLSVIPALAVLLSMVAYGSQQNCFRRAETSSEFHACEGAGDFMMILLGFAGGAFLAALAVGTVLATLLLRLRNVET